MGSLQATESGFLAMLSDEQLGIYFAHQGQPSCEEKMSEILLVKQYNVFKKLLEMQQQAQEATNQPARQNNERPVAETNASMDVYNFHTEIVIPSSAGGKVVGTGGETIRRLMKESNTKIQLNKAGSTTVIQIGADNDEDLLYAQKLIWRELESTFQSSAVVCSYDKQILKLCSQWSEVERYDFQSDTYASVEFMTATDFNDAFVWIRGWDKKRCDNAELKLKAIVTQNGGRMPIRRRSRIQSAAPTKDDGLEKYPDAMNILLLGESGVGKSTFLNAMVNYMKFNSLKQAEKQGPAVLIRSMFNVNGEYVITEPTEVPENGAKTNSNEVLQIGESATQNPQTYVFSYPANGTDKSIRIIDTPGVDDTRGLDVCKENFARILEFIADYEKIHAVCILLRPDKSRLTLAFRYCLNELLVHLHKSASANILFCFTHSKGDSTGSWQTPETLRQFLNTLEKERDIRIEMNKDNMFFFDSESFRYLAQKKQGMHFPPFEVQSYTASWTKSAKETLRLFEKIITLRPHDVNDTLTLNNTKRIIQMLSKPLAEVTASIMSNRDLLNEKHREIELALSEGRSLEGQLIVEQEVPVLVELGYPMTVCTAPKCVKYGKIGSSYQTLYVQECHPHCYLSNVQVETCPNSALKHCAAMSGENCYQCGCSWREHMHIRYKIERKIEKIENKQVNTKISEKKTEAEEAKQFLKTIEKRLAKLNGQKKEITNLCAQFTTFLEKNSILQYNDAFKDYIRYLIRSEKEKISANAGVSDEQLKNLEKYKEDYEKEVNLINSTKRSDQEVTIEDIEKSIQRLMNMDDYGSFLREVRLAKLNGQKKEITNLCAQFTTFLEKNSILQYNDAFKDYIRYLIRSEKEKISANAGVSDEQLKNLEKYKEDYEKEVNLINSTKRSDQEVTIEDIEKSIQRLMNMDDYGSFLREVRRLELLTVGQTAENLSQIIKLKGWKKIITTFYK